jgi:hypothetical protein
VQHGLTVRDEHQFDGQVEQRLQADTQVVLGVTAEVPKPRLRTHPQSRRAVAEDAVAGNERAMLRQPVDRLARACDLERRHVLRHRGRRVVAPHHLVAAALVKLDRDQDCYVLLVLPKRVECGELAVDHQRIDEHERVARVVGDTTDLRRPVGRAVHLLRRFPLGMCRRPAPQARCDLLQLHVKERR